MEGNAYECSQGAASTPLAGYRRREPEKTVLYQLVTQELATFREETYEFGCKGIPGFVIKEFERYLDCGILSNGFARLKCTGCGKEELVGFSCKGRSICPS